MTISNGATEPPRSVTDLLRLQVYVLKLRHKLTELTACGILLNNQRDAALSSRIYSSLQGYSTCFGCFLHPSSGVQLKLQMQS
jgi:hypothetical protein